MLRIWTLPGTLLGVSNDARNFVVEPISRNVDYPVTTRMLFPGNGSGVQRLGQMAGLIVYADDDDFVLVARIDASSGPQLLALQEAGGTTVAYSQVVEQNVTPANPVIYLRLVKSGTGYQPEYSYDDQTFSSFPAPTTPTATATGTVTPVPTSATATPIPVSFSADYKAPQVGVFAWGGTGTDIANNEMPADFDWIRFYNDQIPVPTAAPSATSTSIATATNTVVPPPPPAASTATPLPTSTATDTPTPTATPVPSPTKRPKSRPKKKPTPRPTPVPRHTVRIEHVGVRFKTVHVGDWDQVSLLANRKDRYGVWVHVIFSTGLHLDYYEMTDANGFWTKRFVIPADSIGAYSNQAVVTFQLVKYHRFDKSFLTFNVSR
jgi:hypothetical protein